MNLFWSIFLAVALATQLPFILGLLYAARKIILGLVIVCAIGLGVLYCVTEYQKTQWVPTLTPHEKETADAKKCVLAWEDFDARGGSAVKIFDKDDFQGVYEAYTVLGQHDKAQAFRSRFPEFFVKVDPVSDFYQHAHGMLEEWQSPWQVPPPPPVSKPIPAQTPVPAKPETLYTSND